MFHDFLFLFQKPELEEESYPAHRERSADLSDVKKQISYQSDETGSEDNVLEPQPGVSVEGQGRQLQFQTENPAYCTRAAQLEDPSAEDEGLIFREIPARELDEDDIPDRKEPEQSPVLQNSDPSPSLKEVDAKDGSIPVVSDHKTQCAFSFENALLFELD